MNSKMGNDMAYMSFCCYSILVFFQWPQKMNNPIFPSVFLYQNTYLARRMKNETLYILQYNIRLKNKILAEV